LSKSEAGRRRLQAVAGVVDEGDGPVVHIDRQLNGEQVGDHDAELVGEGEVVVEARDRSSCALGIRCQVR
jgi:hypothetical protein